MPWCLARIAKTAGQVPTSVDPKRFRAQGGLLLWEAFVSGKMKVAGTSHHDDARLACEAFVRRWPNLVSDIPAEEAMNHAVSAACVAGLSVRLEELGQAAVVVSVTEGAA